MVDSIYWWDYVWLLIDYICWEDYICGKDYIDSLQSKSMEWTGFYMTETLVVKDLNTFQLSSVSLPTFSNFLQ